MTNPRFRSPRHTLIPVLASFLALAWISPAQAQVTYSGRAFGASVDSVLAPPDGVVFADTGELPPAGGMLSVDEIGPVGVPGVLSASFLAASTSGGNNVAMSAASLNSLSILPGEASIEVSFVNAETSATCDGVTGSAFIENLSIGGSEVFPTGVPNEEILIPGVGQLVINEQIASSGPGSQAITVNGLHLTLDTGGEIVVASAESDIGGCQAVCHDFVTGGGWIDVGSERGNFGFNAGFKPNASSPTVSFNYIDHNTGMQVKSTGITLYVQGATSTTRHFEGSAKIDGASGTYAVDVAGGNIQLHGTCE